MSTKIKSGKEKKRITKKTKRLIMNEEKNGQRETSNANYPPSGLTTSKTGKSNLPEYSQQGTAETLPESSDASATNLARVGLDSMNLLKKSGNKLMRLIDESVSEKDLQRAQSDSCRVDLGRVMTAVEAAKALASTVQTQVNMLKAISEFDKKGEK